MHIRNFQALWIVIQLVIFRTYEIKLWPQICGWSNSGMITKCDGIPTNTAVSTCSTYPPTTSGGQTSSSITSECLCCFSSSFQQQMALVLRPFQFWTRKLELSYQRSFFSQNSFHSLAFNFLFVTLARSNQNFKAFSQKRLFSLPCVALCISISPVVTRLATSD